jgi:hypothetical protein
MMSKKLFNKRCGHTMIPSYANYGKISNDYTDYVDSANLGDTGSNNGFVYIANLGDDVQNQYIPGQPDTGHHAPEPATMLLFGTGLIGLAGVSRKKLAK